VADPELIPRLQEAVKDHVAGSPVDPDVNWTNRTPTELAEELSDTGHPVDRKTVKRPSSLLPHQSLLFVTSVDERSGDS
jgi:hypothetical protein